MEAHVLQAEVVLVGEEVRQARVGLVLAEHRAGGRGALGTGRVPVLDAHPPSVAGVQHRRDVAGRVDVGRGGAQPVIGRDAVGPSQAGRPAQRGGGRGADAEQHRVALERALPGEAHAASAVLNRRDGRVRDELDAVAPMELREEPAESRADDALERGGGLLDDGDRGTEAARGRGHLAADPARADDHEPAAVADHGAQGVGVGDRPQDAHRLPFGAVDRGPARHRAGGDQQPVVRELLAAWERDVVRRGVERGRARRRAQLDVIGRVEALGVDLGVGGAAVARQVALRERRSLVGPPRLLGDQDDAPLEALLAQRRGGLGAGQAAADDHERLAVRHGFLQSGTGTPGACAGRREGARAART